MPSRSKTRSKKSKKGRSLFNKRTRNRNRQRELNTNEPRRPTHTKQEDIVDYLCEDDTIGTQRYGCISFATITDEMKESYYQQIADQLKKPLEDVKTIVAEWCSRENPKRAVKVRGTFKTLDQTYRHAEDLRQYDPNFHIFTCEVGKWLPFDPDPALLEDENYMEDQLNQLLKGYKENKMNTKQHYNQRKREMMEKAIQEGTPEGQKQLMEQDEPVEAVRFKAQQAKRTIEEYQEKIKELERTQELALKKLEYMDEPVEDPKPQQKKISFDHTVEQLDEHYDGDKKPNPPPDQNPPLPEEEVSETHIRDLERDGIRRGLQQMRQIQD